MFPTLPTQVHRRRRQALLDRMPDRSAALFLALPEAPRNGDVIHPYRPDSDLWYLTGFAEPRSALLLTRGCDAPSSVLFLRDRDPRAEVWTGPRIGVDDAPTALGVEAAQPIDRPHPDPAESTIHMVPVAETTDCAQLLDMMPSLGF